MPDTRRLPLALLALLTPACLDSSPAPEVVSASHEINVDVVWQSGANVSISGNTLTKNAGGTGWNAGASSAQSLGRQGFVRFTTGETDKAKMLGLSTDGEDADQSNTDIDYAIRLGDNGGATAWVGGSQITGSETYQASDLFFIEWTPTTVYFRKGSITAASFASASITTSDFPIQVDTSLRHQGATIQNVVVNPTVHVAPENSFFADPVECAAGEMISISGTFFLEIGTTGVDDIDDFANAKTPEQVRNRLQTFASNNNIDTNTTGTIIMDIEHPHASDLWGEMVDGDPVERSQSEKDDIIEGYRRRIIGARMAFPNAKLGLYGTLVPDPEGDFTEEFDLRQQALIAAGEDGLFDAFTWDEPDGNPVETWAGLDYLVPVLYVRFGCTVDPSDCDGGANGGFQDIDAMTEQGIVYSRLLEKQDNSVLPLLPLLTIRVRNGASDYHLDLLRDLGVADDDPDNPFAKTLNLQMQEFREASPAVRDVVLWVEGNDGQVLFERNDGPNGDCVVGMSDPEDCWRVDDYTCAM